MKSGGKEMKEHGKIESFGEDIKYVIEGEYEKSLLISEG